MLIAIVSVNAQSISVTSNGFVYTQNFNSLPSSGTSAKSVLPNGWYTYFNPTGSAKDSIQTTAGSATAAGFYSVGAAANSERALATLISNANAPMYIGVKCVNNTGSTITAVQVSYKMEQWRRGNNTASHPDTLIAEYNVGSDSIHTGTWTVGLGLSAVSINSTTTVGSLDGNTISQTVSTTLSSLNIPNGATFWLRFNDYNIFGNDDILAVDDLSATFTTGSLPACTTPTSIPTTMSFSNITATSAKVTYNNATPKPDGYAAFIGTVKVGGNPSTFNGTSFVEGNSYTLSSNSYKCINFDGDTTMTASGLTANTKYYVLVTSFNNACTGGPNYATSYKVDSFTTQQLSTDCTQPNGASSFTKTDSTNSTITVKWTNPANADSVMVLIAPSTVGFVTVRDSAAYPVNSTITSSNGVLATVKYRGTDSSFTFSALATDTYYKIFVVTFNNKNCTNGPNYATVNARTFGTAGGVPNTDCTQPSGVSNATVLQTDSTTTSVTITYTLPANADSVMLLIAPTSVGSITIRDSIYYAVGASIASTTATPAVVKYRGTASTFTFTGLTAATLYKVFIYTFNNIGCTNGPNYASGPSTKTIKTDGSTCAAPDTIIGGVTVGTITNNSIAGSVTPAVNASGYVVVYSKKSFLVAPTDSITYSVGQLITKVNGTFIDSSYVGYVGSSPNFTITGLNPGTKYYFAVIPYASCSYGPNYNVKIANSNKNSATTLGGTPSCNAPDTIIGGVTVGTITTNSIAGSVTPAVNASGYVVVYSKKSFLVAPTDSITYTLGQLITKVNGTFIDSSYVGYVGSSPNFTITGLSPGTKYYFAVIPYSSCTYGPNYNIKIANSNKNSATTLLTTGIRNNTNQVAVKLFPNPTKSILNVEFEKNSIGNTNVIIFDNVGRSVYSNSYNINNQLQINLPTLAKGIYIINLENKDFTAVKTFIVE